MFNFIRKINEYNSYLEDLIEQEQYEQYRAKEYNSENPEGSKDKSRIQKDADGGSGKSRKSPELEGVEKQIEKCSLKFKKRKRRLRNKKTMATQKGFKYNINKFKFRDKKDSEEQANRILFFVIQKQLKDDVKPVDSLFVVTELLMEITDRSLLLKTKSLFSDIDFSKLSEKISSKINIEKHLYSENQITRIFAIIIGNYIRYERMKPNDSKEFSFKIKGNKIKVLNVDYRENFKRKITSLIPSILKNDIKAYDQLIGAMDKIDFNRGTDYLERQIKYLERQKKNIFALEENPHPKIFTNLKNFYVFNEYITKHCLDPYKDLSFIFKKLKFEQRIFAITHLDFALFLFKNKFINEKDYKTISDQKGFASKVSSDSRLNNYINILNEIDRFYS